jgi:anthranilate synthase/aminodeoxychorismate synthase-like glutamine amidotransferase
LLIDNYDSFTHNLARYFVELDQEVRIVRNDQMTLAQMSSLAPDYLVISPGPCTPQQSGMSMSAIRHFSKSIPILGVCLGMQAIAAEFGGKIVQAASIMHGKTSPLFHQQSVLFDRTPNPIRVTRYHSLVVDINSVPNEFEVSAWTQDKYGKKEDIMAIEHKALPIYGVQYHPESVMTEYGHQLLKNFLLSPKK